MNLMSKSLNAMIVFAILLLVSVIAPACGFQLETQVSSQRRLIISRTGLHEQRDAKGNDDIDEYRNGVTQFLSNFMRKETENDIDPLARIDFKAPKISKMSLENLASELDGELYEKEWFVTGQVNPQYFDDNFKFQDPDVKLTGIEGKLNLGCMIMFYTSYF